MHATLQQAPLQKPLARQSEIFSAIVPAPFGAIGIRTAAGLLQELVYLSSGFPLKDAQDAVAAEAGRQLARYFQEPDFPFDLPLATVGTAFQQKVWSVIAAIPRGQVLTYGEVAKRLGSAARAVGGACGANWFPLVIPCHRVIAAGGGLGGFSNSADGAGFHVGVKRWLLAHEAVAGF